MMSVHSEDLPGLLEGPRKDDVECEACEAKATEVVAIAGLDVVLYGE